jgi:hypothetical protein
MGFFFENYGTWDWRNVFLWNYTKYWAVLEMVLCLAHLLLLWYW